MSKRRQPTSSAESVIQIARSDKSYTFDKTKSHVGKRHKKSQQRDSDDSSTPVARNSSPSARLICKKLSTGPVKRRGGRPLGSKNKATLARPADRRLLSKHMMADESIAPCGRSGASCGATPNEAIRILTLDQAVSNLGIIANSMAILRQARPEPPKDATSYLPETPRKIRDITSHASPHFHSDRRNPGTSLDSSLRGLSSPSRATSSVSKHFSPWKGRGVSIIRFPLLKESKFGLIQEELASNPFHVLIAVIFLSKTTGTAAIPVIRNIAERYPTPEELAAATAEELFPDIQNLGFGSTRAQGIIDLAKAWVANPPEKGKRYRRLNYPKPGSGKDVQPRDEPLNDEDSRDAFEVAHLPGIGPYGIDSWRIFCRDNLRGVSSGIKKNSLKMKSSAVMKELVQEWAKVQPQDKELRAYIKWRWLRLGIDWNSQTDEKKDFDREILKQMQKGRLDEYEGLANPWKNAAGSQVYLSDLASSPTPQ